MKKYAISIVTFLCLTSWPVLAEPKVETTAPVGPTLTHVMRLAIDKAVGAASDSAADISGPDAGNKHAEEDTAGDQD